MREHPEKITGLFLGPALFVLSLLFVYPEGMSTEARMVMSATLWIATWWITEAIPIPVTSLLPLILFPLTGAMSVQATATAFGHPILFLYVGGFIIAIAIQKWDLHRRIALHIITWSGSSTRAIIFGFMLATAFLSMWISNTASAVMMLPIGIAIVSQVAGGAREQQQMGKALMLAIAYAASIGGIATLIGTPTNLILAGVVRETYGTEISFAQWLAFGLPITVVLLPLCWFYLTRFAFPLHAHHLEKGKETIREEIRAMGRITFEQKAVGFVFGLTALCWLSRTFVLQRIVPGIDDSVIALAGATVLFLIPSKQRRGAMVINWQEAVGIPWGIILLFGGGLALAGAFQSSGLAQWIGSQLTLLRGVELILLLLILIAAINFLTEITSNTATASMILPILAAMAIAIDVHPFILMVAATVAASCAFMLPVATPPNAVVFGSGFLRIPDMVRAGIWMNVLSIVLLTLFVYFLLPLVWGM